MLKELTLTSTQSWTHNILCQTKYQKESLVPFLGQNISIPFKTTGLLHHLKKSPHLSIQNISTFLS